MINRYILLHVIAGYDGGLKKKEGEKEWDGERGEREIEGRGREKELPNEKGERVEE